MSTPDIILKLSNIESYYGPIMAIRGISIEVPRGRIVTLLGATVSSSRFIWFLQEKEFIGHRAVIDGGPYDDGT
jgi:hypothetical protein